MTNLEAALSYAARGWFVFPCWWITPQGSCACGTRCDRQGKHPIGTHTPQGFKNATTDAGVITAWWTVHPNANIALATGVKSNVYVVDCDMPDGLKSWVGLEQGGVDDAPIARTGGGGRHVFFTCPSPEFTNTGKRSKNALGTDIDTRGEGGYALLPPSNHVSGGFYAWLAPGEPCPMPEWLQSSLKNRARETYTGPAVALVPNEQRRALTREDLAGMAFALSTQGGSSPQVAQDLRNILDGKAWGGKGSRDDDLVALGYRLALQFQDMDPMATAIALFEPSRQDVERLDAPDTTTIEYVARRLGARLEPAAQALAREAALQAEHSSYLQLVKREATKDMLTRAAQRAPKDLQPGIRAVRDGQALEGGPAEAKRVGSYLAQHLDASVSVESLAKLADPTLATHGISVEEFTGWLALEQGQAVKAVEAAKKEETSEREKRIQLAFLSTRTEPYTQAELECMSPTHRRWIISAGGSVFVRAPGDYVGPISREDLPSAAKDWLSPAYALLEVDAYRLTDKGEAVLKTSQDLVDEYGLVARGMEYDYSALKSSYNGSSGLFTRAAAKRRAIPPAYNAQVDEWLRLFCGERYEIVQDWLAALTNLASPIPGLYMEGESGSGKNMLALSVARLFEGLTPVSFTDCWSRFNDGLRYQPVVFADESFSLPQDCRLSVIDALKRTVTDETRSTQSKGKDAIPLHGCVRLVIGTNDSAMVRVGKGRTLQRADLKALEDRLIVVRPGSDAVDYLNSLGNRATTYSWVYGDVLAAHVLWLQLTRERPATASQRMLVAGTGGLSASLAAGASGTREFLEALVRALVSIQADQTTAHAREGRVWFNPQGMRDQWAVLSKEPPPEDIRATTDALTERGAWGTSRVFKIKGKPIRQRAIHLPMLMETAARMGFDEEIAAVIAAGSPGE